MYAVSTLQSGCVQAASAVLSVSQQRIAHDGLNLFIHLSMHEFIPTVSKHTSICAINHRFNRSFNQQMTLPVWTALSSSF